ncbi:MAG: hypothetical protein A2X11_02845 [Bacteroidetes bacterium GWE2_42_24]|nr:MAG: hypothetical protein A2X11_02845 [Bacteroidetes bacterium GWE2_42_24]OFY28835.1 MAG: hypothetical protein A2X09_12290 [Bacteroidetes bacterium GWF2_43_11]
MNQCVTYYFCRCCKVQIYKITVNQELVVAEVNSRVKGKAGEKEDRQLIFQEWIVIFNLKSSCFILFLRVETEI